MAGYLRDSSSTSAGMAGTLHGTQIALGIAERRMRTRTLVTPPIYVDLDNINGGLVFNISEDGLALTGALDLAGDGFLAMRIYLPDSKGWIAASGEIAWRAKSKKEGGVRFAGLAEDARRRIKNWIASEASRGEFGMKTDASAGLVGLTEDARRRIKSWIASEASRGEFQTEKDASTELPGLRGGGARQRLRNWIFQEASRGESGLAKEELLEKEECRGDVASVHASSGSILGPAVPALIVDKQEQDAIVLADSDTRLEETVVAKPALRQAQGLPDTWQDARRALVRTPIVPPIYVNLENANGGLIFNMSENGLALTAALGLAGDDPMTMRIQIPDSKGWMEARGQIAWRSASRKTAGIGFLGLPEDSRQRIREWLAEETSGAELRPEKEIFPKREQHPTALPAETPMVPLSALLNSNAVAEKRMLAAILSEEPFPSLDVPAKDPAEPSRQSISVATENPGYEDSSPQLRERRVQVQEPSRLAAPEMYGEKVSAAASATDALLREFSRGSESKLKSSPQFRPATSEGGAKRLKSLAAAATLAGVVAVAIGWVASSAVRNEATGFVAQNREGTNKVPEVKNLLPANKATNVPAPRSENNGSQLHEVSPTPAAGHGNGADKRPVSSRLHVHTAEQPAARPAVNGSVRRAESLLLKSQSSKLPERSVVGVQNPAVENARTQGVGTPPAQPVENTATPATSPSAGVSGGTALAEVKENPPPPPKQPAASMAPTWSVAVSTDPYPSIRIPAEIRSQKLLQGRTVQMGQLVSRVEPVYPEDAKHQGIEGTVRLHVVVDRDGAVANLEHVSGPPLLVKAAMSAVREWRYGQTLLAGQPVETEHDVVLKFKLLSLTAP